MSSRVGRIRRDYHDGRQSPRDVVDRIFTAIGEQGLSPIWISLADRDEALARAEAADLTLPLGGVPFAVKDNIDVEGMLTTAACPSFAYTATQSASVVQRLRNAGAILIGKTNMDQFATGLVGTRTPYGECSSVFDDRFISGGSSSGSAAAVARGLCAFALGTDTAGSGRVPAAFNGLVGLKPTRGAISTAGVVPACRSLDCVSIFATSVADAEAVWRVAVALDDADPYSRAFDAAAGAAPWVGSTFRFGMPADEHLQWFGDDEAPRLYAAAARRLESLGGVPTAIDFEPFRECGEMLYSGPWVAERYAAVGAAVERGTPDLDPIVRETILGGSRYSASEAFRAAYRLQRLRRRVAAQWTDMDVLLLPTTGAIYTKDEIHADPVRLNANLGYYTNFVNLLDLAAVAVPAGVRSTGLPFGVSLIGPAFSDLSLTTLATMFNDEAPNRMTRHGCVDIAVVGAHLTGEPLNYQLLERGARLVRADRTSSDYRLFALAGTQPAKPGLVRSDDGEGPGIDVEVWSVPERSFGGFVAAVPPPLAIGNVRLSSGEWVKGFVCEPHAVSGATDITQFGGWRQYRASAT